MTETETFKVANAYVHGFDEKCRSCMKEKEWFNKNLEASDMEKLEGHTCKGTEEQPEKENKMKNILNSIRCEINPSFGFMISIFMNKKRNPEALNELGIHFMCFTMYYYW